MKLSKSIIGFATGLALLGCSKSMRIPNGTLTDRDAELEQTSGLGRGELFISTRQLWNEDFEKTLTFEYNGGTACIQKCRPVLQTAVRFNDDFSDLGELHDDGEQGDTIANNGVFTVKVTFNPQGYQDRVIRFRVAGNHSLSNTVTLAVSPRLSTSDFVASQTLGQTFAARYRAIAPGDTIALNALLDEIKAKPEVETAVANPLGTTLFIFHKKGFLSYLTREPIPNFKNGSANAAGSRGTPTRPSLSCGGWEGEVTVLSPYYHEFGSNDDGYLFNEAVQADPKARFKVDFLKSTGTFTASLGWYTNLFQGKHGVVLSTHGASEEVSLAQIPKRFQHLGIIEGDKFYLYTLSTNAKINHVTSAAEIQNYVGLGISLNAETGEVSLLPSFFSSQRGRMKRNSFVYLGYCNSSNRNNMPPAFAARGATVVYGYDNYVQSGGWSNDNIRNMAKTVLSGKPLSEFGLPSPDVYTIVAGMGFPSWVPAVLGTRIVVHLTRYERVEKGAETVFFPEGDLSAPNTLTMQVADRAVALKSYGCFLHDTPNNMFGKVWTCRWSRTGEKDSSAQLNLNFPGENPPVTGKIYQGFDVIVAYGERDCAQFNNLMHPERTKLKVTEWDERSGQVSIEFEALLTNNGPIGGSGEDAFKMQEIKSARGRNPLLD